MVNFSQFIIVITTVIEILILNVSGAIIKKVYLISQWKIQTCLHLPFASITMGKNLCESWLPSVGMAWDSLCFTTLPDYYSSN